MLSLTLPPEPTLVVILLCYTNTPSTLNVQPGARCIIISYRCCCGLRIHDKSTGKYLYFILSSGVLNYCCMAANEEVLFNTVISQPVRSTAVLCMLHAQPFAHCIPQASRATLSAVKVNDVRRRSVKGKSPAVKGVKSIAPH